MIKAIVSTLLIMVLAVSAYSQKKKTVKAKPLQKAVFVNNATELKNVLSIAKPGDSIVLKDGIYTGRFVIPASANGTNNNPILLTGSRNAILDAGDISKGYVLHLNANYWKIKGLTLKNGLKGLVADEASNNVFDGIFITEVGEEGLHLRKFSKNNIIQNCEITYTGLKTPGYGEAIYIGSANSNWHKYSNGEPDKCDSNKVINNKLGPFVAAECIDIKEGTTGGLIKGNVFDSKGITGANSADSWIDVKGNNYLIEDNVGYNSQPSVLLDGFQVNCAVVGWGNYNVFKNNTCNVNAAGYGFNIRLKSSRGQAVGNVIKTDNIVNNAERGIANIALTD